jgi:hypothetical protein
MFLREFNRVLSYGASELTEGASVRDFAESLNVTCVERQGFWAEYSGARAVGLLEVRALFPVGQRTPDEQVGDGTGLKFGELIPAIEVPLAYDDAGHRWEAHGDERLARRSVIEVARVGFPIAEVGVRAMSFDDFDSGAMAVLEDYLPVRQM